MPIQVSQARTSLDNLKQDLTDLPNATFEEWCHFANQRAYRFLAGIDPGRFFLTQNFTVAAAPTTSALPANFMHIQSVGTGFFRQDDDGTQREDRLVRSGFGSQNRGYYIEGTNVVFTGIDASETFTLRYLPLATTIDDLTDFFTIDTTQTGVETIPDEYLEALRDDLDKLYNQWDELPGSESVSDFRFSRLMDELARTVRKEPYAIAIRDYSSNF